MNGIKTLHAGCKCCQGDCPGRLIVYSTRINFALGKRIRYLRCDMCGDTPEGNKQVVPLEFAPSRARD